MPTSRREFLKTMALGAMSSFTMMVSRGSYGARNTRSHEIDIVAPDAESVPRYGKFEARIEIIAQYENPFDPAEVDLLVHFLTPTGETHVLPAFYHEKSGEPGWKVRYAPLLVGDYRYYVALGDHRTEEYTFKCVASHADGFIRLSPHDYRYFQFDYGLQDGSYEIEWWDTYQTDKVERVDAVCAGGILRLETPEIEYDIACKIRLSSEIGG